MKETDLINKVVDNTIDISTEDLIDYTQLSDSPWGNAYKEYKGLLNVISKDSIKQYIRRDERQRELLNFINKKVECEGITLIRKVTPTRNTDNK